MLLGEGIAPEPPMGPLRHPFLIVTLEAPGLFNKSWAVP